MNAWKRCALLEHHHGPCAAWPHLPDTATPRQGTRCTTRVAPRTELFQRIITRRELTNETSRRDILTWTRIVAARHGYRGRISLVKLDTDGPPAVDLYAIRVHPARKALA